MQRVENSSESSELAVPGADCARDKVDCTAIAVVAADCTATAEKGCTAPRSGVEEECTVHLDAEEEGVERDVVAVAAMGLLDAVWQAGGRPLALYRA